MNNLVILIISHGRPNDVITVDTLKKAGNKHPFYIVVDNHDKKIKEYIVNFGKEKVKIFDKDYYANLVDHYDNFYNLRTTTHARNACFDISDKLGYKYFLVLDDDYTSFKFRIDNKLKHPKSCPNLKKNISKVFDLTLDYFINSNYKSLCFSQGGDWFGGEANFNQKPKRKAMNSFFCSTDRKFLFFSRLNEDVNTYMGLGQTNNVFMTIPFIQLDQKQTQQTKGGMTEAYLDGGTYVKSFYTVLNRPDCTKVSTMGRSNRRLHHNINWKYAKPLIISEKHKK
tara:strand:+ start:116 stop:964 length:849 start_codon:yes stop_codon:yes gene_type:complete